jgi:hypothetical protein
MSALLGTVRWVRDNAGLGFVAVCGVIGMLLTLAGAFVRSLA